MSFASCFGGFAGLEIYTAAMGGQQSFASTHRGGGVAPIPGPSGPRP
jgi:hypothetical protein